VNRERSQARAQVRSGLYAVLFKQEQVKIFVGTG